VSKPFTISYPPDDIQPGWSWKGLNNKTPAIFLTQLEAAAMSNIWLRNQEIRSTPPFILAFPGPNTSNATLGQTSFMDANGTIHTCAFTSDGIWQLNPYNTTFVPPPWTFVGGPNLTQGVPVASRDFANILYYTNGAPYVQSWDGIGTSTTLVSGLTNAIFGGAGSSIGSQFLYEINNQICLLNVSLFNVASVTNPIPGTGATTLAAGDVTNYPQLLWYSANGIPNQFDPSVNTSAGFNNFLDVPDQFTGVMAFGEVAYLFRNNGITYQTISENTSLTPFYFDHLWSSEEGMGNVYPWSIAQYGSTGFFISTDNVYKATVQGFNPIGGGARDAIMEDLSNATLNPVASIIPKFNQGYVYLRYELCIPMGSSTRIYSYSLEDDNWMPQDLTNSLVTARPSLCWR
jgi:hypothetical protein